MRWCAFSTSPPLPSPSLPSFPFLLSPSFPPIYSPFFEYLVDFCRDFQMPLQFISCKQVQDTPIYQVNEQDFTQLWETEIVTPHSGHPNVIHCPRVRVFAGGGRGMYRIKDIGKVKC